MKTALGILLSYLLGSIPTGYIIARVIKKIDIRQHGSGNVGATNVFRVVGKKWGIMVLIVDVLKGWAAVFLVPRWLLPENTTPFLWSLFFGIASISGHSWTVWLGLRGGKGVATSLGVLFGLVPKAALASVLIWIGIFWWKRYVSLGSLAMALSFPLWVTLFYRSEDFFRILLPISIGITCFIFYTHRSNIQRLQRGKEEKLI